MKSHQTPQLRRIYSWPYYPNNFRRIWSTIFAIGPMNQHELVFIKAIYGPLHTPSSRPHRFVTKRVYQSLNPRPLYCYSSHNFSEASAIRGSERLIYSTNTFHVKKKKLVPSSSINAKILWMASAKWAAHFAFVVTLLMKPKITYSSLQFTT